MIHAFPLIEFFVLLFLSRIPKGTVQHIKSHGHTGRDRVHVLTRFYWGIELRLWSQHWLSIVYKTKAVREAGW